MHKTRIALTVLASVAACEPAFASSDITDCLWGSDGCLVVTPPVLAVDNDTRDNLLRLASEKKDFSLPLQPLPEDLTRIRSFYFAYHDDASMPAATPVDSPAMSSTLADQIAALGLTDSATPLAALHPDEAEDRHVSNNVDTLSRFFAALLADGTLTPQQRHALAQARLQLPADAALVGLDYADGAAARAFSDYLQAAAAFYQGNFSAAGQTFAQLQHSTQPWVAETASYMLMRNALNQSSQNASGEYGDFDVKKVDKAAATQARTAASAYLQAWPQGQYAASARGMMRRIDWYLEDWDTLAQRYEQALHQADSSEQLIALIAENDRKLQSKDQSGDSLFISAPDAPLLTFTQTLRLMRAKECQPRLPCVDRAFLDGIQPIFTRSGQQPLWHYLNLMLSFRTGDYAAVVNSIKPASSLPKNDILAFSEQVLYGDALMAQQQWSAARDSWKHLLSLSQNAEQQQLLQSNLAAALVAGNEVAHVFAPDSQVTSLRYRSLVLKTRATPELLRQQASAGPNDEERTIALHTLLMQDLMAARYADWLQDRQLSRHISHPAQGEAFADVQLSTFDWPGSAAENGYACPTLEAVVTRLNSQADDSHALNCLGEFFRTSTAGVNVWQDRNGNGALDDATATDAQYGRPDRQRYYQQAIAQAKTEPEDKSYALYRAVMCYAPSGYNDCGGQDVDKSQRKRWFNQLKTNYPGSVWARKLKYYW